MLDAIRFTVTVTAIVERKQTVGSDWAVVGQKFEEGHPDKPVDVRGYTPEIEKVVQKEIKVYEQTVSSLDMATLVKVINIVKP
jgi:hypothetical protein